MIPAYTNTVQEPLWQGTGAFLNELPRTLSRISEGDEALAMASGRNSMSVLPSIGEEVQDEATADDEAIAEETKDEPSAKATGTIKKNKPKKKRNICCPC